MLTLKLTLPFLHTQVGDTGAIEGPSGSFSVDDTRVAAGYVLHVGRAAGGAALKVGDSVTARFVLGAFTLRWSPHRHGVKCCSS